MTELLAAAIELGQAFQEAEAALPGYWILRDLEHDGMTWAASAGPWGGAPDTWLWEYGETLAEALHNLAAKLAEPLP